jgi:hypothetical protein
VFYLAFNLITHKESNTIFGQHTRFVYHHSQPPITPF